MFGTILISIITILQVYVFWRITTIPLITRYVKKKHILTTGLILWIIFIVGRNYSHDTKGPVTFVFEFFGMNWLGIVFILFFYLFIADIITLFGLVFKKYVPYIRAFALFIGFIISAFALFQGLRPPVVNKYEIHLDNLPSKLNGTALVAVSDTHLGSLIGKTWLKSRVAQINSLNPDIILLLGDIHEGHGISQDEFIPLFKNLNAPMGVWSVLGNHEFHRSSDENSSLLESSSNLLKNEWMEVKPGLILAGVNDFTANRRRGYNSDLLSEVLKNRPEGAVILLSHSPLEVNRASELGVGLMLSGHTHGGQIWPFNYFIKRIYPMIAGRYSVNDMTLIISRGAGTWGPRMRLWKPGEILYMKLFAKPQKQ